MLIPLLATSKHAVLGLVRALYSHLYPNYPIRINSIAPSWTDTGIVPREILAALGEGYYQSADVVGRSVTVLMADEQRHGEMIYSDRGEFMDLENGAKGYHAITKKMLNGDRDEELSVLSVYPKLLRLQQEAARKGDKEGAMGIGRATEAVAPTAR